MSKQTAERACKPNSVPDRVRVADRDTWSARRTLRSIRFADAAGRRSFIWARRYRRARAPYPGLVTSRAGSRPLFGLAGGGVYPAAAVADRAVRSYRTFSPLPTKKSAVYFLRHFPWARARWPLAITVPCPVRTFLPRHVAESDRPARSAGAEYTTNRE